jgi:hypothetical protein
MVMVGNPEYICGLHSIDFAAIAHSRPVLRLAAGTLGYSSQ